MKTELRFSRHAVLPDQAVVEIWYDGEFIGQITGADGPGVRILSKYELLAEIFPNAINVVEVGILHNEGCNGTFIA